MQTHPELSTSRLAGRKVNVFVNREVNPNAIQDALKRIYELSGCTACGFLGFDVIFHGVDPAAGIDAKGLQGINGIAIGQ